VFYNCLCYIVSYSFDNIDKTNCIVALGHTHVTPTSWSDYLKISSSGAVPNKKGICQWWLLENKF